ncbi:uncharacterized protein METZ01_LOCUS382772, partial [marine metagenome]
VSSQLEKIITEKIGAMLLSNNSQGLAKIHQMFG